MYENIFPSSDTVLYEVYSFFFSPSSPCAVGLTVAQDNGITKAENVVSPYPFPPSPSL